MHEIARASSAIAITVTADYIFEDCTYFRRDQSICVCRGGASCNFENGRRRLPAKSAPTLDQNYFSKLPT